MVLVLHGNSTKPSPDTCMKGTQVQNPGAWQTGMFDANRANLGTAVCPQFLFTSRNSDTAVSRVLLIPKLGKFDNQGSSVRFPI